MALHELRDLIARHASCDALALPGTLLLCADAPCASVSVVCEPMLCLVAQGAKRIVMGEHVLEFGAASSLVVTMAMPVASEVTQACSEEPYLAVGFPLSTAPLAELLLAMPPSPWVSRDHAIDLQPLTEDLLGAAIQLLRLLDRPADVPVLAPLRTRELLYRLLTGAHASALRGLVQGRGASSQVARAAAWIRSHHHQPLRIAELAALVSLSESALHRNFKALTGLTPLGYQKHIRLITARSRLLAEGGEAADVGFAVGYNSPSQFSREYARLFGEPPARDAARLRSAQQWPGLAW